MPELLNVTQKENEWFEVEITIPDMLGASSLVTGLITSYGMDIFRGKVETGKGQAHMVLEVKITRPVEWKKFEEELKNCARKGRSGKWKEVRSAINNKIVAILRSRIDIRSGQKQPVDLQVDQESSAHETVINIGGRDSPAFLYELTYALSALQINIVRMEVDTQGDQVKDRIWVTDQNGRKITSQEKLRALQWTVLLIKQFSERLPTVPDPSEAFEKIILLGKDLFDRGDFDAILLALRKSQALESLSTVLGTSRFLWEEFIRSHQTTLVRMLSDHRLLTFRKQKDFMQKEVARVLNAKDSFDEKVEFLNEFKDREMFRIDLRHLLGKTSFVEEFAEEFSDLVEVVVEAARNLAWEETIKKWPKPKISDNAPSEDTVFALGKLGGREVGFASDLELLFVYTDDPDSSSTRSHQNQTFYSELVRIFRSIIRARSEGVFEIDMRLRPHGDVGPLAVSREAFKKYYTPGGGAWGFERQALVKLRPIAGSETLGKEILGFRDEFVYGPAPFDFDEAIRLRKRQRSELVATGTVNAKYSAGGLLDVEYIVQTLQMVYGQGGESGLRDSNTLRAIRHLRLSGILSDPEYKLLYDGYIFLRDLINALRVSRGNAKDLSVPSRQSIEFVTLARRMGYGGDDKTVTEQLADDWALYRKSVADFYESKMGELASGKRAAAGKTEWSPLEALDFYFDDFFRDSPQAKTATLVQELGFHNPTAAFARIRRMAPAPNTRNFRFFRQVLHVSWKIWPLVANPDLALHHLERFSEVWSEREPLWRVLSLSEDGLSILLRLFGTSMYLSEIILAHPGYWLEMKEPERRDAGVTRRYLREMSASLSLAELRIFRHRETLRIALAEMFEGAPLEKVYEAFSELADYILENLFQYFLKDRNCCILGFGKLGGRELNFSSDVDLMFVVDEGEDAGTINKEIQQFINALSQGGSDDFLYRVDLRLRPHGKDGALFLAPKDYLTYYQNDADAWEFQVLLKGRPVAGKKMLGEDLLKKLEPLVYAKAWPEEKWGRIRKIKRRYEALNRSHGEENTNIKMGPGGIRDIEFTVQTLQLLHGTEEPSLRKANTLEVLSAVQSLKLLPGPECQRLRESYLFVRRIENRIQLYENRQVFNVPQDRLGLRWLSRSMGFKDESLQTAEVQFMKYLENVKRDCRQIFERIFYGGEIDQGD